MKKYLLYTLLLFTPLVSFAENIPNESMRQWNYYIVADMGVFISDVEINDDTFLDLGVSGMFEFGAQYDRYRLGISLKDAGEASGVIQALAGHTVGIENISLRLNGYYDYVSYKGFAMYVGAGLGVNRYDYKIKEQYTHREESDIGASFTAGAKTGMTFGGGHMCFDIGFAVDYISFPRIYSYGPTVGLRYKF